MTNDANLRKRIRERAAKTGESYTAARRRLVAPDERPTTMVVAVSQTVLRPHPRSGAQLRDNGERLRELMPGPPPPVQPWCTSPEEG